jgi:hypothetical protein
MGRCLPAQLGLVECHACQCNPSCCLTMYAALTISFRVTAPVGWVMVAFPRAVPCGCFLGWLVITGPARRVLLFCRGPLVPGTWSAMLYSMGLFPGLLGSLSLTTVAVACRVVPACCVASGAGCSASCPLFISSSPFAVAQDASAVCRCAPGCACTRKPQARAGCCQASN